MRRNIVGLFIPALRICLVVLFMTFGIREVGALPMVHTSDFIVDTTRSNFNSFENIPNDGTFFTGGSGPYTEDGIQVRQINSGSGIWVTYNPGGRDGLYAWYPNGGDLGYTSIRRDDGSDFTDVGFLIGSGNGTHNTAYFELWNDGALLLAGSVGHQVSFHYLGFEGGGFDTIFLRDGPAGRFLNDGTHNALTVDAIEIPAQVSEPNSLTLLGLGLIGAIHFIARHVNRRASGLTL